MNAYPAATGGQPAAPPASNGYASNGYPVTATPATATATADQRLLGNGYAANGQEPAATPATATPRTARRPAATRQRLRRERPPGTERPRRPDGYSGNGYAANGHEANGYSGNGYQTSNSAGTGAFPASGSPLGPVLSLAPGTPLAGPAPSRSTARTQRLRSSTVTAPTVWCRGMAPARERAPAGRAGAPSFTPSFTPHGAASAAGTQNGLGQPGGSPGQNPVGNGQPTGGYQVAPGRGSGADYSIRGNQPSWHEGQAAAPRPGPGYPADHGQTGPSVADQPATPGYAPAGQFDPSQQAYWE